MTHDYKFSVEIIPAEPGWSGRFVYEGEVMKTSHPVIAWHVRYWKKRTTDGADHFAKVLPIFLTVGIGIQYLNSHENFILQSPDNFYTFHGNEYRTLEDAVVAAIDYENKEMSS